MTKLYLVTGASSGIGEGITKELRAKGNFVLTTSRRHLAGEHYCADLGIVEEITGLAKWVKSFGKLDGLINNAGFLDLTFFEGVSWDRLVKTFEVNLFSVFELTRLLIHNIFHSGHILNIASISGMHSDVDSPHYGAAKAGLISLTKSLAIAYPSLRVNCISPGLISTNLVEGEVPQTLLQSIPLYRAASVSEVSKIALTILESDYITGSNIVIDGGVTAK